MESRIETLVKHSDKLFQDRLPLLNVWQDIALSFYVERGDFTVTRSLGEDFASNLSTSYPLLARRSLGETFSAMLRPSDKEWFHIRASRDDREDNDAKRWLQWATRLQRRAMYDRVTQFVRATKEADHDFAAFGQCVISVELNREGNALLYRCWHLRDVVWCEDYTGKVGTVYRKWEPFAVELNQVFRGKVSASVTKLLKDTPYERVKVRHAVIPADQYEKKFRTPYVSVFFEFETGHILEEVGTYNPIYVIPRWQTVSGSQYAFSPATVAALPDARLIQAMTLTLLEAGEKAVNPPLIATEEAVRSDIQVYAGGITWVDREYDEKLGEVLRPITQDLRGIPLGMDMRSDAKQMILEAFYLNKISLPPIGRDMTAFETGQRIQEYIRNALPLFEPMEMDYNGAVCDLTFDVLKRAGAFGPPDNIPESLRGADVQFRFESPLHEAVEKQKGSTWLNAKAILADAVALDPSAAQLVDARAAMRDVLDGIGVPAKWVRSEEQMEEIDQATNEKMQAQELIAAMQSGGAAAEQIGKAGLSLNQMQQTSPV